MTVLARTSAVSGERVGARVDPRGQRFAAALTSAVVVVALLLPATPAGLLLATQGVVFALGAFGGLRRAPYGLLFRRVVLPRIGPPTETEDEAPPRFAQAVGLAFAAVASVGFLLGHPTVGLVAGAACLVAALLNAVLGLCLGCEVLLAARRLVR